MRLFIAILLLNMPMFISAKEYSAKILDVRITVEAITFADHHDWTNEYKLDVKLVSTQNKFAPALGLFKISDSKNQFSNFTSKNPLKLGESFSRSTRVILPTTVLNKTGIRITLLEEDFTIPVPGPCCIYINNNDLEVSKTISLSNTNEEIFLSGTTSEITISVKLIDTIELGLGSILKEQSRYLYRDSEFRFNQSYEKNLYLHVLNNI